MKSLLVIFLIIIAISSAFPINKNDSANLVVVKKEKNLVVTAKIPKYIKKVEIRIESDRNNKISRITDISPDDPEIPKEMPDQDIWYPVVDVDTESLMEGVAKFSGNIDGLCIVGGPFFTEEQPLKKEIIIFSNKLEFWENSVFVKPASNNRLSRFYLRRQFPVMIGRLEHTFKLLSDDWSGKVSIYTSTENGYQKLSEYIVPASQQDSSRSSALEKYKGKGLTEERLTESLKASVDFTLRCQNKNPHSPTAGGPFLFYDLDAKMYRTSYWMWGWGPSVSLLLDAQKVPGIAESYESDKLLQVADDIGRAALKFQVLDEQNPGYGLGVASWSRNVNGYYNCVTATDVLFMAKWSWVPLFIATGDSAYLKATKKLCLATDRLMDEMGVVPSIFYYDSNNWSNHLLDESGFGTEGIAALYDLTGEEKLKQIGIDYMEMHLDKLQLEDGLWARHWFIKEQKKDVCQYKTRGIGWAMEGLLATYEMSGNKKYLNLAEKIAEHLLDWQQDDGCWGFIFNKPEGEFGKVEISEKGTALWSLLFYRIYHHTKNEYYLRAARNALNWCLENQYTGPDIEAFGNIVGKSRVSGVGYRKWYPMSCVYTSAFFGLAALEELKIMNENNFRK